MGKKTRQYLTQQIKNALYEKAAEDLESGNENKGIWAKALVKAEGDETKAKAFYIDMAVEEMILEEEAIIEAQKAEEKKENNAAGYEKTMKQQEKLFELGNNIDPIITPLIVITTLFLVALGIFLS